MPQTPEEELEAARVAVQDARAKLVKAVKRAQTEGMTLRAISEIVGLSHESIRRITNE
jgi:hypothetical protein